MCVPSVNGKSYGMATYLILLMFDTRWQSIDWHYLDSMAWSVTVARCCAHVSFIMPQKENCEEKWKEKWGEETTSLTDKSIFVTQVAKAGRRKKVFPHETSDSDQMDEIGGWKVNERNSRCEKQEAKATKMRKSFSFSLPLNNREVRK